MIVSLLIFLVLCFEGIVLAATVILLTVRDCASWSDRPFTIRDVEDELNLVLSTKTLSIAVHETLSVLAAKFTV
jgi:hypothetical protein